MRREDFTAKAAGNLVSTTYGAHAFVPAPLPRDLDLDRRTSRELAEADNALGQLNGTTGRLVHPYLVASPLLRREAILSSRIEGTFTTPTELVLFEEGEIEDAGPSRREDTLEVANYMEALRYGLNMLSTLCPCAFDLSVKSTRS